MGISLYDIEQVIPHRGTMRLIDRLLDWDDERIAVEVIVPVDGPFNEYGNEGWGVPAWIGIEYMAQAIAAWAGCRVRAAGHEPKIGLLLGSRRYLAEVGHFISGSVLRVEAQCDLMGDNGLGLFTCRILHDECVLACATVPVYQPDNVLTYLENGSSEEA